MMKREFFYLSKDGSTTIHAIEWIPEGKEKGIVQICHGMAEHIDRYHEFAEYLSMRGFYVVGHDHLGHGRSVSEPEKFGYFHETDGNAYVIADMHQLRIRTEKMFPGSPFFMLGHSMGSFLLRQYLGLYSGGLSGAVIMGTGDQSDIVLVGGKLVCKLLASIKGWDYRSNFVHNLADGAYTKKYGAGWLSKNTENVEKYKKDPMCGFCFTLNGYYHMFSGMKKMNEQEKAGKTSRKLPLFFVSGGDDLVGNCGKGVKKVYRTYKSRGYLDVEMKLYRGDRHEILNEADRQEVFQDIFDWLVKHA